MDYMKADNINLLEFLGSSKRTFNIPVYQRNYDWKVSHCKRLFDDVEKIIINEKESHFLGTIVYVDGEKNATFREFIVIDGQQRLTSTMILLKALHDELNDEDIKADILEEYLINRRAPEKLRIKLKPIKSDYEVYNKIINGEKNTDTQNNIFGNYKYFCNLIENSDLKPEEIYKGIQKLEIVYIQLDSEKENPQLIFESLNSTGLDLTQADLIRNFLLMGQTYSMQEHLYKKYWVNIEAVLPNSLISDFIRDYLTLKTSSIPKKEKVYDAFKQYYEELKNYNAEGVLEELLTFAEYYSWFTYCNSNDEKINLRLKQLQRIKSTTVYPFLLNVFEDCYLYKNIDQEEVTKVLDVIISYVFRRLICEIPTNALNKIFASIHKDISKNKKKKLQLHENVALVLLSKKGKAIFPRDEVFKESFITKDIYNFKQCKYLLECLEGYKNKEQVDFSQITIEHIMPQTLSPKWQVDLGKKYKEIYDIYLHRIGNLTLSGYNGELSNKSYEEKKLILLKSNVSINRDLSKFEYWNEKSIEQRGVELFNIAKEIWSQPNIDVINIEENDAKSEFDLMEDNNVTGREPVELTIIDGKKQVNSWREFFRAICMSMYEYDAEIFKGLVKHKDFKGRTKRIITEDIDSLRAPFKITDTIFIEQNLSANDALNYSKLVVEKYEGMEDEVTYRIR
ncbi:DUF262 domain-containing protein [Clostridium sp. DL1XJH146]